MSPTRPAAEHHRQTLGGRTTHGESGGGRRREPARPKTSPKFNRAGLPEDARRLQMRSISQQNRPNEHKKDGVGEEGERTKTLSRWSLTSMTDARVQAGAETISPQAGGEGHMAPSIADSRPLTTEAAAGLWGGKRAKWARARATCCTPTREVASHATDRTRGRSQSIQHMRGEATRNRNQEPPHSSHGKDATKERSARATPGREADAHSPSGKVELPEPTSVHGTNGTAAGSSLGAPEAGAIWRAASPWAGACGPAKDSRATGGTGGGGEGGQETKRADPDGTGVSRRETEGGEEGCGGTGPAGADREGSQ